MGQMYSIEMSEYYRNTEKKSVHHQAGTKTPSEVATCSVRSNTLAERYRTIANLNDMTNLKTYTSKRERSSS